eukprot:scaffold17716_cov134-Isochrysis_galbana.AAC.1
MSHGAFRNSEWTRAASAYVKSWPPLRESSCTGTPMVPPVVRKMWVVLTWRTRRWAVFLAKSRSIPAGAVSSHAERAHSPRGWVVRRSLSWMLLDAKQLWLQLTESLHILHASNRWLRGIPIVISNPVPRVGRGLVGGRDTPAHVVQARADIGEGGREACGSPFVCSTNREGLHRHAIGQWGLLPARPPLDLESLFCEDEPAVCSRLCVIQSPDYGSRALTRRESIAGRFGGAMRELKHHHKCCLAF